LAVLLALGAPAYAASYRNSLATHDASRWLAVISAFSLSKPAPVSSDGTIAFIGSSSIGMWTTLAEDFPERTVVRRGFGGSQLADLVIHFDGLALPPQPRQIVVYAGANDLTVGKAPDIVLGDFVALVEKIQQAMPQTKVTFISIAPNPGRWAWVEHVKSANRLIEDYCEKNDLTFVDVFSQMLGPDGQPLPDIYLPDQVHMNAKGYDLWCEILRPYLQ
jgi:lysophospholipase L1-like esterase